MKSQKTSSYHHENLREKLIDAALVLINEKGARALTIREVARRAGASHTAPYRHFKDKADLLTVVARQGFDILTREMKRRSDKHAEDPLKQFKLCGLTYIQFALDHPAHYRVMFGQGRSESRETEALLASAHASFELLLNSIKGCQKKGLIKPGDPMEMALSAWSSVHGFSMLVIEGLLHHQKYPVSNVKKMMDSVTDAIYFGLTP